MACCRRSSSARPRRGDSSRWLAPRPATARRGASVGDCHRHRNLPARHLLGDLFEHATLLVALLLRHLLVRQERERDARRIDVDAIRLRDNGVVEEAFGGLDLAEEAILQIGWCLRCLGCLVVPWVLVPKVLEVPKVPVGACTCNGAPVPHSTAPARPDPPAPLDRTSRTSRQRATP